jgi:hypothetical protein
LNSAKTDAFQVWPAVGPEIAVITFKRGHFLSKSPLDAICENIRFDNQGLVPKNRINLMQSA